MKLDRFKLLSYLVVLTFLIAPSAMGDTTVIGTGNSAEDLTNVQDAVNLGGVVTLQGNFDFDAFGVNILNSVEIVGQSAIISNGIVPFYVIAPGSNVVIRDIAFINSTFAGIMVDICNNFLAKRIIISGVESFATPSGLVKRGIWAGAYDCGVTGCQPNTDILKFHVVDCNIDLGSYNLDNPERGIGIGAWGLGSTGEEVDVLIKGNSVNNCSYIGVLGSDIAGNVMIENNIVKTGNIATTQFPLAPGAPWGVLTEQSIEGVGYFSPAYQPNDAQFTIANNYIETGPDVLGNGKLSSGIYANSTEGLIIRRNSIKTVGGWFNILFGWDGNNNFIIEKNELFGGDQEITIGLASATNGLIKTNNLKNSIPLSFHVYAGFVENNVFIGNNINTDVITYYFEPFSANNIVKGKTGGSDSVVDFGDGNFFTGVTPMSDAGGIGQQVSQAMHELHERMSNGGTGPHNLP
jgi:hypothetical protein